MGQWTKHKNDGKMMTEKQKKVIFSIPENDKAKFKVQLQYDSLTQTQFFRGIMSAYLAKEQNFMNFIGGLKENLAVQSRSQRGKSERGLKEGRTISKKFALEDSEVENIFDMLEKEQPDL